MLDDFISGIDSSVDQIVAKNKRIKIVEGTGKNVQITELPRASTGIKY